MYRYAMPWGKAQKLKLLIALPGNPGQHKLLKRIRKMSASKERMKHEAQVPRRPQQKRQEIGR
jgi:hypothetical protein